MMEMEVERSEVLEKSELKDKNVRVRKVFLLFLQQGKGNEMEERKR